MIINSVIEGTGTTPFNGYKLEGAWIANAQANFSNLPGDITIISSNNRRSFWCLSGDVPSSNRSDIYPFMLPNGSTKIKLTTNNNQNVAFAFLSLSGSTYSLVVDSGWQTLVDGVTEYNIPPGATHLYIGMRNTSNINYTIGTEPTHISLEFI